MRNKRSSALFFCCDAEPDAPPSSLLIPDDGELSVEPVESVFDPSGLDGIRFVSCPLSHFSTTSALIRKSLPPTRKWGSFPSAINL